METFAFTFTGRMARDPRPFTTQQGRDGVSMWIEIPLTSTSSRYVKVVAWGNLAAHAADSLHLNDRVTVRARDFNSEQWTTEENGKQVPHSCVTATAGEISVSLLHDTVTTGSASRKAAQPGSPASNQADVPAGERADLSVLDGVTANAA